MPVTSMETKEEDAAATAAVAAAAVPPSSASTINQHPPAPILLLQLPALACLLSLLSMWTPLPWLPAVDLTHNTLPAIRTILCLLLPAVVTAATAARRGNSSSSSSSSSSRMLFVHVATILLLYLAGILAAAVFAILFGAPATLNSLPATLHWAALFSLCSVLPSAILLEHDSSKWQQLFAQMSPTSPMESSLLLTSISTGLGSWLGAFPMPLDWDQPWQEWPVTCTHGLLLGYVIGSFMSGLMHSSFTSPLTKRKQM